MLIVYALAALISMAVAWVIKLIFAGIRKQQTPAVPAKAAPPADTGSGKAI